jgi:DNA-binding transcriptional regulator YiaG
MTGATLAAWRTIHSLSADDAAALLGTSRQVLYRWEAGMQMSGPARRLLKLLHDPIAYRRAVRQIRQQEKSNVE